MIYFKTLRYQNILSTGNQFTELALNEYKNTLIIGENGAGKTTAIDALFYVLYGKPLRPINKPQLVNSITNKNLLVELEFSISTKNYLVRRGMKPNIFEIYCNDKMLNQDSQSRDYQEMLESQILKINYKSFSQVVVLSMANYTPFMKLPAGGRREVIEDLLDIQIFSVMNSLLRDKIIGNKDNIQEIEYNIKLTQNKLELHKKHIAELNQNNKDLIRTRREKIEEYNEQIRQLTAQTKEISKELQTKRSSLKEEDSVRQVFKEKSDILRKSLAAEKKLLSKIQFYTEVCECPTCTQRIGEVFKSSQLQDQNERLAKIRDNLPKLKQKISDINVRLEVFEKIIKEVETLDNKILRLNTDILMNEKFISSLEADIKELETKVKKIKEDNTETHKLLNELKNQETAKNDLIVDKEVLSLASQLLKDGGIKTKIIRQYIPIMNKLINSYLAKMDFFIQFELDETFKETIKSRFRDEFSYESFSQGEKLRIDLALLFSWRAIAKMRNSVSTNLLFFDEVLDSSLDINGVDEFLKIIKNLTSDTNLFIISHRGDQLADKFDNTLRFEKKHNFSRLIK